MLPSRTESGELAIPGVSADRLHGTSGHAGSSDE